MQKQELQTKIYLYHWKRSQGDWKPVAGVIKWKWLEFSKSYITKWHCNLNLEDMWLAGRTANCYLNYLLWFDGCLRNRLDKSTRNQIRKRKEVVFILSIRTSLQTGTTILSCTGLADSNISWITKTKCENQNNLVETSQKFSRYL